MNLDSLGRLDRLLPRHRGTRRLLVVLLVACALGVGLGTVALPDAAAPARAAERPAATAAASFRPPLQGVWIAGGLLAALILILLVAVRRAGGVRTGNGDLHVVDTLHLGGRRLIHLVRCGDRKYLIGNSERGIHYLSSLPQGAEERELDEGDDLDRPGGETPFSRLLARGGRTS